MNLSILFSVVQKKVCEFLHIYKSHPEYIKVYEGFTITMMVELKDYFVDMPKDYFMGMKICETPTVNTVYDIEVF